MSSKLHYVCINIDVLVAGDTLQVVLLVASMRMILKFTNSSFKAPRPYGHFLKIYGKRARLHHATKTQSS